MKMGGWFAVALIALAGMIMAADGGFAVHMVIVCAAALAAAFATAASANYPALLGLIAPPADPQNLYYDDVVRWGVVATVFWGVVGFLAGVVIASQLSFPGLNLNEYLNFGRLRPLHTSAVVFAFGGNALIATSF